MVNPIRLGISSCLLGEKVRYDGQHKLDYFLKETLGEYVEWVPVCPEVEMGLPIPREAMRLTGSLDDQRLVTVKSGIDYTDRMNKWASGRVADLGKEGLCGFVFKSRSPSSGMKGVKLYDANGVPKPAGIGLFARAFMESYPLVPVEDEGRLHDPALRENFIERIFVFGRWRDLVRRSRAVKDLVTFHTEHKLIILAHSPKHYALLGRLVAGAEKGGMKNLFDAYLETLMEGMKLMATTRKNTNVLQHMMGYFRKVLSPDEKNELAGIIEQYRLGFLPLIVPVTLIKHYVRKYDEPYLKRQLYLNPHPAELMLRNHV